jgi:hypothetical protein
MRCKDATFPMIREIDATKESVLELPWFFFVIFQ